MYAVVNHLHFNRPAAEFSAAVQDSGGPRLAQERGFRQIYFVQEAEDQGIIIILWDDAASAAAGAQPGSMRTSCPTWPAPRTAARAKCSPVTRKRGGQS